jgi:preprotein translocase subunit SecA
MSVLSQQEWFVFYLVEQALAAALCFEEGRDYLINNGEVIIIACKIRCGN